jgi:hypothetical protein
MSGCALCARSAMAQKKTQTKKQSTPAPVISEMEKLRQQYLETTKEYKASLERLLVAYKTSVKKAEDRRDKSNALFKDGLISRTQFEEDRTGFSFRETQSE